MIKTLNYTYDESNSVLFAKTGMGMLEALNDIFEFDFSLLESYCAKNYKLVSKTGEVFSGDFEDLLNMLNASGKVEVVVAKSHRNNTPAHTLHIKKVTKQEEPQVKKKPTKTTKRKQDNE